jgi:hypothetical protein
MSSPGKRKANDDSFQYSANENTQRERKRQANRDPERKQFENARKADNSATLHQLVKLRATLAYTSASLARKMELEAEIKERVKAER